MKLILAIAVSLLMAGSVCMAQVVTSGSVFRGCVLAHVTEYFVDSTGAYYVDASDNYYVR